MNENQAPQEERRSQLVLREIFEEAYVLVSPFLDTESSWDHKPMVRFAQVALREKYPAMSPQDATILLGALRRVYAERRGAQQN